MNQLDEPALKKWAHEYIQKYEKDIIGIEGKIPDIPFNLYKEIDSIISMLKTAHAEGKKQSSFRDINERKVTLNLEPLLNPTIDDLTLQTYISRLFLYSRGG